MEKLKLNDAGFYPPERAIIVSKNLRTFAECYGNTPEEAQKKAEQFLEAWNSYDTLKENNRELLEALWFAVEKQESIIDAINADADWFNNNTPNVGLKFPYKERAVTPDWLIKAKAAIKNQK